MQGGNGGKRASAISRMTEGDVGSDGGGRWFKNKFLKKWAIWISLYKVRLNPCPLLFDVKFKEAFKNSLHNNRWARCFL